MRCQQIKRHAHGFNLVELMIALVLGLLILGAVIQLFIGSRVTYMSNEALARVQENGRFAMEMLKPQLRSASFRGMCAGRAQITNHLRTGANACNDDVQSIYDLEYALVGWEFKGTGIGDSYTIPVDLDPSGVNANNWESLSDAGTTVPLPTDLHGRVVPGTDVVVTRNLIRLNMTINGTINNTQLGTAGGGDTIPPGSIVLISNCQSGSDIFQQSKRQNDAANPTKPSMQCETNAPGNGAPGGSPWGNQHDGQSSVFVVEITAYYIGFNADRGEPGLYRVLLTEDGGDPVHEELVEGMENMQIAYGVTTTGENVGLWQSADDVQDWSLVVAARVGLIARSPENADMQSVSQDFDLSFSTVTGPEDSRLRHAFSSTMAVRNQQIVL